MQSDNLLNINLAHAAKAAKRIHVELTNDFFADLEQEEISGGAVHADILVLTSVSNIYTAKINMTGYVIVSCDRCLDPLRIEISTNDEIKIKDGEEHESDAPDLRYFDGDDFLYDLSWDLYEIIETSLPMQRVHPQGECNQEMLSYILGEDYEINEDENL